MRNAWRQLRSLFPSLERLSLERLINRGLPPHAAVTPTVRWPLFLLPLLLFGQLVTPHFVWISLFTAILALYGVALIWARAHAEAVTLERSRRGVILVAGDSFEEEFVLRNGGPLPVLWAHFIDASELPGYDPSQVVAADGSSSYRWRAQVECRRRGLFRIGPYEVLTADPFSLFRVTLDYPQSETLLIYPRVVQLPQLELPRGEAGGSHSRRRPLFGALPSASVRDYAQGDSLRFIHWPTTARRGDLTVKELELEPSGDVWIALDLEGAAQRGEGEQGTLEHAIIVAASLAAELLGGGERRAVGLLAASGGGAGSGIGGGSGANGMTLVPPQRGQAQLWRILAALAPVSAGQTSLGSLLHSSRGVLGRRRSLAVITPALLLAEGGWAAAGRSAQAGGEAQAALPEGGAAPSWLAELLHLQRAGLAASVLLVARPEELEAAEQMRGMLAMLDITAQVLPVGAPLAPVLTYRRRRKVTRSTPTGGVVVYEVEEEVG